MWAAAHAARVVVLDDDTGGSRELEDGARRAIGVQQVVEAEFLALELFAGGDALALRAGLDVETGGLVGVLTIPEALLGDQPDAQAFGQLIGGLADLTGHPGGDRRVVGGGALEGRQGAAPAVIQIPGARLGLFEE